ncbi:glycosyltransferase family 2 protein [Sporosarcina sp. NPDC096371]|uniref:glycosyltransferase family 2 protein n=1 Tax=Sporosarcina sp. NPDC096371 TaxID=3364530 RepID=UPI003809A5E7
MVKFSVIVPVYNASCYLKDCLNSIVNQTFRDIELILVNDGSTDNSGEICLKYQAMDDRIKVIERENGGAGAARNIGLTHAAGDFIIFCDSDDFWSANNFLEIIYEIITMENPELIIFDYKKCHDNYFEFLKVNEYNLFKFIQKNDILKYLINNNKFTTSANWKVIRSDVLLDNNIYFPEGTIAEDMDWGLKVYSKSNEIIYVDKKFYVYRQWEGSITRLVDEKKINDLWSMIKKWTEKTDYGEVDALPRWLIQKYFSFHYLILIATISSSDLHNKRKLLQSIKSHRWLLDYIPDKKIKLFSNIRYIVGFKIFSKILGYVYLFKRK